MATEEKMSLEQIGSRVLELLVSVAPDIDPASVDPALELRDQFDFDSMDRLHFAAALSKAFQIEIPEPDYAELGAVQRACGYVARKLGAA